MNPDWNEDKIRKTNNCYNYANNKRTDTFAQPGRASGPEINCVSNGEIIVASIRDGLKMLDPHLGPDELIKSVPDDHEIVALVVAHHDDYHWYRLDRNSSGIWSHKPGRTRVTTVDEDGKPITDPRMVEHYFPPYEFVAFMSSPRNVIIE